MNRHIGDFVQRCLTCQQVKVEHQKSTWLLQPLEVAEWKWEHVTMDLVTHLLRMQQRHDAVWDDLRLGEILPVVHSRDSPATWSTSIHSVG